MEIVYYGTFDKEGEKEFKISESQLLYYLRGVGDIAWAKRILHNGTGIWRPNWIVEKHIYKPIIVWAEEK